MKDLPTVLIIDDERSVIKVTSAILNRKGFNVFEASTKEDLLYILHESGSIIDFVLLDYCMPELNSHDVFRLIKNTTAGSQIIITSGGLITDKIQNLLDLGAKFVQKPFTFNALLEAFKT